MFEIQIRAGVLGVFETNTDGFDTFDEAKAWALANVADLFESNYACDDCPDGIWRIVARDL